MSFTLLIPPDIRAQEGITPPQGLVNQIITLYRDKTCDVNDSRCAQEYISLFEQDLESLLNYNLNDLDEPTKIKLSEVYNNYGLSRLKYSSNPNQKDLKKAKSMYELAIKLDSSNIEPLFNLGIHYYSREKNYIKAKEQYEKVLKIDPNNALADVYVDMCNEKLDKIVK